MPFAAKVFRVLIASPSDVQERTEIAASIHEWNNQHASVMGCVLLPVAWETHAAPLMGERPQEIINRQIVRSCDMLIGVFWTRLGSPTGVTASGTMEEIDWFLSVKRPVMLYYSRVHADPDTIDSDQLRLLREYKDSIRKQGLQEQYAKVEELNKKLLYQLTIVMRDVMDKLASTPGIPQSRKRSTVERNVRPLVRLVLRRCTLKSFYIDGDTSEFRDRLPQAGGQETKIHPVGLVWQFSNKRLNEVSEILGIDPLIAD